MNKPAGVAEAVFEADHKPTEQAAKPINASNALRIMTSIIEMQNNSIAY
jgi:hypothetical protein